jgi:PAS domain S-box-containing protein
MSSPPPGEKKGENSSTQGLELACATPRLLGLLLDSVEEAVMATDLQGTILYWNQAAQRLYGWESKEVLGKNIMEVTPSEMTRDQAETIMHQLSQGQKWTGDFQVRRKDGTTFIARATDTPIRTPDGELIGIVGTSYDRTQELEQEQQERQAQELQQKVDSERAFHSHILKTTGDPVVITDLDGKITYLNDAGERLYGRNLAEVAGMHVDRLMNSPTISSRSQEILECNRLGRPWEGIVEATNAKGRSLMLHLNVSPVLDANGTPIGTVGMGHDLSTILAARRQKHAAARERALQSAILSTIRDAVSVADKDGRIIYWNEAAEALYGWRKAEMLGKDAASNLQYEAEKDLDAYKQELIQGNIVSDNFRSRHKNGKWVRVTSASAPIHDANGEFIGSISVSRDRSKEIAHKGLKAVAERHKHRLELLRQREADRTRFIHMVSHELNNPLTPIITQLAILKMKLAKDPSEGAMKAVEVIERNVQRTRRIVQDLLDVSRIQGNRLEIQKQIISSGDLLRQAFQDMNHQVTDRRVRFDLTVGTEATLEGDPHRLAQVVQNLLRNALNHTPAGGTITLSSQSDGQYLDIRVQDTGAGLKRADLERIFEPFEQVGQSRQKGSGLGLYICKGIVESHGGQIWAESPGPGKGATFTFRLPQKAETTRQEANTGPAPLATMGNHTDLVDTTP